MRMSTRRLVPARSVRFAHPFAELDQLWRELDRWAAPARLAPRRAALDSRARVTHDAEAHTWTLSAPLPGIGTEQLEVTVDNGVLTISTTPAEASDEGFTTVHRERPTTPTRIRWSLPEQADLDGVKATLTDGWLSVVLPEKTRPELRTIVVHAG